MLLHLPIAIMVTLSPIAVSDSVPQFDIVRECRFEGGSTATFDRCSRDETGAFSELKREWAQFSGADQKTCLAATTTTGGFRELCRAIDLPGNGTRRCWREHYSR
jgi:hypothetical protein